jgi:hypothetical protein
MLKNGGVVWMGQANIISLPKINDERMHLLGGGAQPQRSGKLGAPRGRWAQGARGCGTSPTSTWKKVRKAKCKIRLSCVCIDACT